MRYEVYAKTKKTADRLVQIGRASSKEQAAAIGIAFSRDGNWKRGTDILIRDRRTDEAFKVNVSLFNG